MGAMVTFVFAALTMKAVGRAAGAMVAEVRRQFREIPGILEGTAEPEYAKCVHISTVGAQKEMVAPALLGILTPIIIGMITGVAGVMGVLTGGLTTGFVLAVMMNNAGGAWDNAKKYVETGHYGGKGSDYHKATVIGDTVGDPFKDTSGPSINILIKLMSMVSIVFAGLIVAYSPMVESIYSGKKEKPAIEQNIEEEILEEESDILIEETQE
jgi:K(+)-stimulated pyrophosphate-energized sodium pump